MCSSDLFPSHDTKQKGMEIQELIDKAKEGADKGL